MKVKLPRFFIYVLLAASFLVNIILISRNFSSKNNQIEKPENTSETSPSYFITPDQNIMGEEDEVYIVTKVIDGDTISLENRQTLRYIGIDAPETSRGEECFSEESTNKNKELVLGKEVRLQKDVSETDRYGRLLRYVWVGEVFVNDYLVREGYASVSTYPPDVKYQQKFVESEKYARENNLGLWSKCGDTTPLRSGVVEPTTGVGSESSASQLIGEDKDCGDFATHAEAQEFFISQGGPDSDPHELDQDGDGLACESLP